MFGSSILKKRDDAGPPLPLIPDFLEQDLVFFFAPLTVLNVFVQMILPSFPALFGCFEVLSSGLYVEIFGDFVPLSFWELTNYFFWLLIGLGEKCFFIFFPRGSSLGFDDIE